MTKVLQIAVIDPTDYLTTNLHERLVGQCATTVFWAPPTVEVAQYVEAFALTPAELRNIKKRSDDEK